MVHGQAVPEGALCVCSQGVLLEAHGKFPAGHGAGQEGVAQQRLQL